MAVAIYPPNITYTPVSTAITAITTQYGISKTRPNKLDNPLYNDDVYGIKNINTIIDAATLSGVELNLLPKKSGMVFASICCVITLVLLPNTFHARSEPIKAFPSPAHVEASPKFHPNCPAYPTKITAEKYEVPKANAVSHGPTERPPRTNPFTSVVCLLV